MIRSMVSTSVGRTLWSSIIKTMDHILIWPDYFTLAEVGTYPFNLLFLDLAAQVSGV